MKTDIDIKTDVFRHIKGSVLESTVTGELRYKRPHNSKKEDIVVSVLANMNGQKQIATVNVNIYVPAISVKNQPEEDIEREELLCRLSSELLDVFRGEGFRASLIDQRVLELTEAKEYLINNKIEYKIINE
jgi:hypothetical protein